MSKHPTKLDCWSPFHIVWFLQGWRLLRRTMRLEFLYKLLLDSLPAVVVLRIVPYYLTPCPIFFFFPVQKSVVQVLLNVVMRALLHHFSLINVHLWITHLHIWCVGSIGCLRQHRGVGFGARCHRWQGSGAFVPCLCVSSHSKQRGRKALVTSGMGTIVTLWGWSTWNVTTRITYHRPSFHQVHVFFFRKCVGAQNWSAMRSVAAVAFTGCLTPKGSLESLCFSWSNVTENTSGVPTSP